MINCEFCGKETTAGTRGLPKRFCSKECRSPRKTERATHCCQCGIELIPSKTGRAKIACSKKCLDKRKSEKLKQARQRTKSCHYCKVDFVTGSNKQKFCSVDCRRKQHKIDHPHQRNTEPKKIVCGWCGQIVIVPPSFTSHKKYHPECKVQARRARYRIKTVKRQSLTVIPSRLSADQIVAQMGAVCGICKDPIDLTLKRTSKMGLTVDHIIPLSRGGQDTLDNMQPAHWVCNVKKGNKVNA